LARPKPEDYLPTETMKPFSPSSRQRRPHSLVEDVYNVKEEMNSLMYFNHQDVCLSGILGK
jgi:hypothetical protein